MNINDHVMLENLGACATSPLVWMTGVYHVG